MTRIDFLSLDYIINIIFLLTRLISDHCSSSSLMSSLIFIRISCTIYDSLMLTSLLLIKLPKSLELRAR